MTANHNNPPEKPADHTGYGCAAMILALGISIALIIFAINHT